MKTKVTIEKEATKRAYLIIITEIRFGRFLNFDMRFNVNKLAYQKASEMRSSFTAEISQEIRDKRKQRMQNKPFEFKNILDNPIVKDYISNNTSIKFIFSDRISFIGRRNHWAKSDQDRKILSILNKYHKKIAA